MSETQANEALVTRYVQEVVNEGKLDVIDEIYAEDYLNHTTMSVGTVAGRGAVAETVEQWRSAFPDLAVRIDDVISDADRVATRITVTGTHEGDWRGLAATGQSIEIRIISIFRIENGLIQERWENADMLSLLQQLGIS